MIVHLVLQGLEDPSLLAEDFVFAAPVIYLKKQEFIGALGRFKVKDAFPGEIAFKQSFIQYA